jgi:predicted DNA-binding transcriptional regulator AlpA
MRNDIIRLKKAADYFNVSRTTIWRWRKQGLLKPYQIGNIAFIRVSDVLNEKEDEQPNKP